MEALEDLLEAANGKQVIAAYWFKHDAVRITKLLNDRAEHLSNQESIRRGNKGKIEVALIPHSVLAKIIPSKMLLTILTFDMNAMAYSSQILLSAVNGVDIGQHEAAVSLGFAHWGSYRPVVLLQAIRNTITALLNEFNSLLKEGAIARTIALGDLFSVV